MLHYGSRQRVVALARLVLERRDRLTGYLAALYIYRRAELKQAAEELGVSIEELTIDIKGAVEELGIVRVIDEVGLARVIDEVGLARVIDEVGLVRVIDEVGPARVIDLLGRDRVRRILQELDERDGTE
ncbi:MAG: hypothetical protein HYV63_26275 [Candidatus Schekmanbacteria bacterium]|nr:hypothetical protein [Candidatus Schekmanbacteria bacterium]